MTACPFNPHVYLFILTERLYVVIQLKRSALWYYEAAKTAVIRLAAGIPMQVLMRRKDGCVIIIKPDKRTRQGP